MPVKSTYRDFTVPIPADKIKKEKNYIYFVLDVTYDPVKKYSIYKKKLIGKVCDETSMYPNDNYYELFPEEKIEDSLPEPDPDCSDVQRPALPAVVDALSEKYQILDKLTKSFGRDPAALLLDVAAYFAFSGSSTVQHFPAWAYDHPHYSGAGDSDSTISRLLKSVTQEEINIFLDLWNKDVEHDQTIYVNGDATNMNTDGKGIELAEIGYAKDDKTKPQINIAQAASRKDNLPLFYDLYAGSYNDVSEFPYLVHMAEKFGYTKLGFILDRGYFSKENIKELTDNHYELVMMVKDNNTCYKEMVTAHGQALKKNWRGYIPEQDVYGMTEEGSLFKGDDQVFYRHLYFSEDKEKGERQILVQLLQKYEKELEAGIREENLTEKEAKKYARYFNLVMKNGCVVSFSENQENIDRAFNECGFFMLVTSENLDSEDTIQIYRSRDAVEKLFESIKTGMDCIRFCVHSDVSLQTKVFLIFIATILRSQFQRKLKEIRGNDKKNYTVTAGIKELEKILLIRQDNGKFERSRKLTMRQKKMLGAFDISEKEIDMIANKLQ